MAQHNGEIGTRHASDYDDFYIATKVEAEEQIQTAKELVKLVEEYVQKDGHRKNEHFKLNMDITLKSLETAFSYQS